MSLLVETGSTLEEVLAPPSTSGDVARSYRDAAIVLLALVLLAVVLVGGTYGIHRLLKHKRKHRKRSTSGSRTHHSPTAHSSSQRRRRRRRARRGQPTRAEVGGLPPKRVGERSSFDRFP